MLSGPLVEAAKMLGGENLEEKAAEAKATAEAEAEAAAEAEDDEQRAAYRQKLEEQVALVQELKAKIDRDDEEDARKEEEKARKRKEDDEKGAAEIAAVRQEGTEGKFEQDAPVPPMEEGVESEEHMELAAK